MVFFEYFSQFLFLFSLNPDLKCFVNMRGHHLYIKQCYVFRIHINFINYAKSITTLEEQVIATIFHACKSLLSDKTSVWVKKDNPDFDVTMGSCDGAQVCELVGLYLLNQLTDEFFNILALSNL